MKKLVIAALAAAGLALLAACASLGGAGELLGTGDLLGGGGDEAPAWLADFDERQQAALDAFGDRIEEIASDAAEAAAAREAEIVRLQGQVADLEERVADQQTVAAELYTEAEAAREQLRQAREFLDGAATNNDTPAVEAAQEKPQEVRTQ